MAAAEALVFPESALAERWAAGPRGPLRLEDGRALRIVFPGVPGGSSGPDFTDAILDAGGDLLRGDVELHLRASGWQAHGHAADPAYAGVVLHVVAANDSTSAVTAHHCGRLIPILVLPVAVPAGLPGFIPPCAVEAARGREFAPALERMSLRRLRAKAARVQPLAESTGPGQALYALALETLGGSANREPFAALARRLPLASLLESSAGNGAPRALTLAAGLKGAAATIVVRRAGLRPMASPGRRLEAATTLFARWWPGPEPAWPASLAPPASWRMAAAPGIGRSAAIELLVNAVLPVALASSAWPEPEVESAWRNLPSPGVYGRLKKLEGWLGSGGSPPFTTAARLQGGLLLHNDYCTKGACGRCPLSS
jgi:hypothetical protein